MRRRSRSGLAEALFEYNHKCAPVAETYIRKIRNSAKREYALAYWRWMKVRGDGPEPVRPSKLGGMGAQAVRISLGQICDVKWLN
jgi:hypothetical protein